MRKYKIDVLDVIFTVLATYMWTFANIDWQRFSYTVDIAPFTWRVAWRALIMPVEILTGSKIASLLLFAVFFFFIMVLTSDFKEKILLLLVFIVGSLNFMYVSDSLVVLALILIKKYPNSRFAFLGALIKEDVFVFLLMFNRHKSRFLAFPIFVIIRLVFNSDYQVNNNFLTIFTYLTERLNMLFWAVIILVIFYVLAHQLTVLSYDNPQCSIFIPIWVSLMLFFGNFWEINKHIPIFYALKQNKTKEIHTNESS